MRLAADTGSLRILVQPLSPSGDAGPASPSAVSTRNLLSAAVGASSRFAIAGAATAPAPAARPRGLVRRAGRGALAADSAMNSAADTGLRRFLVRPLSTVSALSESGEAASPSAISTCNLLIPNLFSAATDSNTRFAIAGAATAPALVARPHGSIRRASRGALMMDSADAVAQKPGLSRDRRGSFIMRRPDVGGLASADADWDSKEADARHLMR